MSILTELWAFVRTRKKYWLVPMIIVLAIFGILFLLASTSVIAPFIYTLF
jgi:competence protein ComGC